VTKQVLHELYKSFIYEEQKLLIAPWEILRAIDMSATSSSIPYKQSTRGYLVLPLPSFIGAASIICCDKSKFKFKFVETKSLLCIHPSMPNPNLQLAT